MSAPTFDAHTKRVDALIGRILGGMTAWEPVWGWYDARADEVPPRDRGYLS